MKRLYRSDKEKLVGGVCAGLGVYFGLDPLILRILFVILALVNGIGMAIYLLMWLLVPRAQREYEGQEEIVRSNVEEMRGRARELGQEAREALEHTRSSGTRSGNRMLMGGAVLVGAGLLVLLQNLGLLWSFGKLWPIVIIAVGAMILLNNLKDR